MTTCDETGAERVPVDAGLGVDPGPGEITTDLVDADLVAEGAIWSLRCDADCDPHTALVRGLAQYLAGLEANALGRVLRFLRVTEESAEVEDEDVGLPVAAVHADGEEGRYAATSRTPTQIIADGRPVEFEVPGAIAGLFETGVYQLDRLTLVMYCGSKAERGALAKVLARASWPSLGRGGFYLRLRHYHGAIARFILTSQTRTALSSEVTAGQWLATFRFVAAVPVIAVHELQRADVRVQVTAGLPAD